MTGLTASRAAFIGSGRLLVACVEIWLGKGHRVAGVVSACPTVAAWCAANGVERIAPAQDQAEWLRHKTFEYLFSIVNHAITPAEVLAMPLRRAINYHDSPLPRYSGFNATSWAIMDGQTRHAITWHAMTVDVDGGEILLQQSFEIRDDDTAFSLGAKCLEAGWHSFTKLLDALQAEEGGAHLASLAQGPRETFHLRSDRPGLGVIDLGRSAAEIQNLVRALDLGADDNWMCRPKLAMPAGLFVVEGLTLVEGAAGAAGSVVAVDRKGVAIAVADGVLRFSLFATLEGEPVDPLSTGAEPGQMLAAPEQYLSDPVRARDARLAKHERFWVNRLAAARPPSLPDLKSVAASADRALVIRKLPAALLLPGRQRRIALTAALAAYAARTGEADAFDLALSARPAAGLSEAYAAATPMRIAVDLGEGFARLCEQIDAELTIQETRETYARDIFTRYDALRSRASRPILPVAVQFAPGDGLNPAAPSLAGASLALIIPDVGETFAWSYDRAAITDAAVNAMADRIDVLLGSGLAAGDLPIGELDLLEAAERELLLTTWQDTTVPYAADSCIHTLFEACAAKRPEAIAVVFEGVALSYSELNQRADAAAEALRARGVGPDDLVAVAIERSLDLMVGLLGVLKAGGAYVPLDPAYPRERLSMMLEDAQAKVLLTRRRLLDRLPAAGAPVLLMDEIPTRARLSVATSDVKPENLAYVIFTSGSTGRPKGVMVRHRNVANFFTGMDAAIGAEPGVWLAVTSVSFDISVLELFWTLTRGFEVVIQSESDRASLARRAPVLASSEPMAFSLFYFAAGQGDNAIGGAYRLLLEGAKFADAHDFSAVWTPERHFHEFGGPYPNPAVTTAALATITSRIALRAGSIVLPLHNPLRVAEDWSVIDQLSGGRVGLSFASGWHADDFAFMPDNYERRREIMLESIETVKRLWRGEKIDVRNGQGKTIAVSVLPRPVQAEPPMWIASAGSVETFKLAGRLGANVLTNMLGQDLNDLRTKFAAYREARNQAGHAGPGVVSVMLHTFVCEDTETARELARAPFCNYLRSSFDLIKVAPSMFPAFRQPSLEGGDAQQFDAARFTDDDMAALMDHAFDRYFETAGLFGSPEKALVMVEKLKSIGANEVACLIDFGVETETVLESLPHLDRLRRLANPASEGVEAAPDYSVAAQLRDRGVTHLQCTPSMARMIAGAPEGLASLAGLRRLLLGGEALPVDLAEQLLPVVSGEIHNMYGPTETTIWSTTARVSAGRPITIGAPIANTLIRILDQRGQLVPIGVAGELCIGGAGVVRGYLSRPDLTAERFRPDPFQAGGLLYHTGDLARFNRAGEIEFLGRLDHQVKVNGYRIELGEIEAVIQRYPLVKQTVVTARHDEHLSRLIAYIVPARHSLAPEAGEERVARWQGLWDDAYRQAGEVEDPRFNIAGWNDSATGAPIPAGEMREWLDWTERRILALKPDRVLEIGCGTGMVLYRVAPHVTHYTGVDLSPHALEAIRNLLTGEELAHVSLLQQPAHLLEGIADKSCDTVVINSVAQYFPDAGYLESVLRRASELTRDGGQIFVGDVRSRDHLEAFHAAAVLQGAPGHLSAEELRQRIARRMAQEGELVLSEAFFHALVRATPRLTSVEINLKRGQARNEMTAFRYDVVLHVGAGPALASPANRAITCPADVDAIAKALLDAPSVLVVRDVLNARVCSVYGALAALASDAALNASALRDLLAGRDDAIDPERLSTLHADYDVDIVWARSGDAARVDALFRHKLTGRRGQADLGAPPHDAAPAHYANAPASVGLEHAALIEDLRMHVREFLPDYMSPSAFVILDALPLTPNGKIDRNALPAPGHAAPQSAEAYVPPSDEIEEAIASVWRSLLGVDRVGRRDNIFDLGANSLLTAQANQRLSSLLDRKVSLVSMFRFPTVESLAAHLNEGLIANDQDAKRLEERAARKKDAAGRRRELRAASQR